MSGLLLMVCGHHTEHHVRVSLTRLVVDFYNQINLLYGSITEFCSPQSCPEMKATDELDQPIHCLLTRFNQLNCNITDSNTSGKTRKPTNGQPKCLHQNISSTSWPGYNQTSTTKPPSHPVSVSHSLNTSL